MDKEKDIEYPLRINRYLALKGFFTRRGADELIAQGRVKINGRVAKLGDKMHAGDVVDVGKTIQKNYVYFAYYKPVGIVTHTPQGDDKAIADVFKITAQQSSPQAVRHSSLQAEKLFPLGRLDKESEGLIILTNDGRITDRLLNPEYTHEKEYLVKVNKPINGEFVRRMTKGVVIDGSTKLTTGAYRTKPAMLQISGDKAFRLIIVEGKKHQIRRMCTALGYEVVSLRRMRIMNIELRGLHAGEGRKLAGKELDIFLKNLGI